MNRILKKNLKKLCAAVLTTALLFSSVPAFAIEGEITRTSEQTQLALGVTNTHTRIFTQNGWQNVNVVKADLSQNPYIQAVPLFNESGTSVGQSVLNMAKDHDTLAAINSDFFDTIPGSPGKVSPIGTIIEDGEIVSTPAHDPGFATFGMDCGGKPFFDYFTYSLKVTSPSGVSAPVKHINKFNFYGDIVYLDQNYGSSSIGSKNGKFELVVKNDTVVEKREGLDPVAIPEDGYVLNCSLSFSTFLKDYFSVGEKVVFEKFLTPDLSQIQTAVGTGSMILKNGQKTELTFDIAGINPRSAVGFDASGNTLYLIAIDGRQSDAIGMTTGQVADFMLEMGLTDGCILDGGGSTNLVTKDFESGQQEIVNQPSQNGRAVASGIGLQNAAPLGDVTGLILFDDSENMFTGGTKPLRVYGYDQYFHKIDIDQNEVSFRVDGVSGSFSGTNFTAASSGTAVITASYRGITGTKTVSVLGEASYLSLPSSFMQLGAGESKEFKIQAKDASGFAAPIPLDQVKVTTQNGCVSFSNQKLTGVKSGEDMITFQYGKVTASAKVVVTGDTASVQADGFESANGSFLGYPSYVAGGYEISSEQKHSGNSSGKLSFDFTDQNSDLRAAYLEFSGGKALPSDTQKVSLWLYSGGDYNAMLRGMIYDSDGQAVRLSFSDRISAGGWTYLEATVPSDLKYPAKLSRLYVVQNDKDDKFAGSVYFDDLSILSPSSGKEPTQVTDAPTGTKFVDALEHAPSDTDNAFQFSVYGAMGSQDSMLSRLIGRRLEQKFNQSSVSAFLGDINYNYLSGVNNEKVITYGYGASVYDNVTMIRLDNSIDGLRKTNADQWGWFLDTLNQVSTKNVMIYLPRPVSQEGFTDPLELELFQQILTEKLYNTGKTAVVVSAGDYITTDIKDGIRYFTVTKTPDVKVTNVLSKLPYLKYFEFSVSGGELSYEVKSIF